MPDVQITFGASIEKLVDACEGARKQLESLTDGAKTLLEAFGIAFSVEKLVEFVDKMAELGERTEQLSAILGVSTGEVGRLNAIAEGAGMSTDALAKGFEIFQANLQKAATGMGPAANALHALGLSAKDFIGLPFEQQLAKFADAQAKFADGGTKLAAVRALWGRMGDELIPLFDRGSKGFADLAAMAERAGTAMDEATTQSFAATKRELVELGLAFEGLGIRIFSALKPAIDAAIQWMTNFIEKIDAKTIATALTSVIDAVASFLSSLLDIVETLREELIHVGETAKEIVAPFTVISKAADLLNKASRAVAEALAGGAKATADSATSTVQAGAGFDALRAKIDAARASMEKYLAGLGHSGAGGETAPPGKPQVPSFGATGANASGALTGLQDQIKLLDQQFAATQQHLDAEVKLHQITATEETQILLAELDKRKVAEDSILAKEASVGGLSVAQQQKITDQKLQIDQKYAQEHQKIIDRAAQQEQKDWQSITNPILSAWNSQLKGLLSGTETFGEAMKNIFSDMVLKIIEYLEKVVVEEVIVKGLQVAIGGPAALLPSFDAGTNYVASSGLAVIHAGESIIPAAQGTGPFTGGGAAGGGANVNINLSALDQTGMQALINRMMPQLARGLQNYQTQNPSFA